MAGPQPFKRSELPSTLTRLQWQAKIRVGIDTAAVLGLTQAATDLAANASQLLTANMKTVGAVESLEPVQSRGQVERFGFGPNPYQPFEIAPMGVSVVLKMTKAVFFNLPDAERIFNFYPSNLLYQQLPFILQVDAPAQNNQSGGPASPPLTHLFLGCWFAETSVRYSVTEKDNQRMIQSATVRCASMVTFDGSLASGITTDVLSQTFGGVLASGNNQAILDDFQLG